MGPTSYLGRFLQALEDGEDLEELAERSRKRGTNKLLRDAEASGRGTPVSDTDSRARKAKKGKSRMSAPDYEPSLGSKRKRGLKSISATPSVEDDDDDRQPVGASPFHTSLPFIPGPVSETPQGASEEQWQRCLPRG
jgi:hypothetical protein